MKYEAGNRFTPDTYFKTEVDSTSVTVKVTGELEGVEVSFDSGDVPEITSLSATENRTYEAPEGTAYNEVIVEVPNSYTAEDEGKVVSSGALVAQTSTTKTANGTYNTTTNNEVVVEVPNTYTAADEGKVVSSGALVAQTSTTKTANGTYDTTLNNEVVVNVPSGSDLQFKGVLDGSITDLVIPSGITSIRTGALVSLNDLETVIVPEGVTVIGEQFCSNCNSLTNVEFPTTLTEINNYAFNVASGSAIENLTIVCKATTPPTLIGNTTLCRNRSEASWVFQVPAESVQAYKSAWTVYSPHIEAIPTP